MPGVEDVVPNLLFEPREVAFELDRLELVDGRLELSGRWFGVQGRRFMRPTLTLRGDDGEIRLLADLAHKPWAAENGEEWQAAFPCDGELDAGGDAELTVAPDLTVEVAIPDAARSDRSERKREAKARAKAREGGKRDVEPQPSPSSSPAPAVRNRAQAEQTRALSAARAEIATLRERIGQSGEALERERTRFAKELRGAEDAKAEALRVRDEAIAGRRKAVQSREVAQQTIEQALAVRGKAKRAAEHALAERDEALARLHSALAERDAALAERDQARARHEQALQQRDQVLGQRDQAAAQRDRAAKELKRAIGERDELALGNEQLRHRYESPVATRGAAAAMRSAVIESSTDRRHAHWLAVAIAVTSLLVVTLAVILILSSH